MKLVKAFILLLVPILVDCQEVWSLEDCIKYARDHSIDLRKSDINISNARVETKLSEQQLLPSLDAGTTSNLASGRSVDPTSNDFVNSRIISSNFGVAGEVSIYKGGILRNRIAQNKVQEEILEADREVRVSNLIIDMIRGYFDALLTKDNYSNVEAQLHSIDEQIRYLDKLVTEGSRAQYELLELHAQQASIERQLLSAEHAVVDAMQYVKSLLNFESEKVIQLATPEEYLFDEDLDEVSLEILTERILKTMPDLKVHELILRGVELDKEISEGINKPTVRLRGSVGSNLSSEANKIASTTSVLTESLAMIDGNQVTFGQVGEVAGRFEAIPYHNQLKNNLSVGLSLQVDIPIFDRYRSRGAQEQAQLQLELVKADKEQFLDAISYQTSQYLNRAHGAAKNLKASEKLRSVRRRATENAIKRFELGAISSYDFIDLQEKLNIAELEYITAKYEYLKIKQILDFYQGNIYPIESR